MPGSRNIGFAARWSDRICRPRPVQAHKVPCGSCPRSCGNAPIIRQPRQATSQQGKRRDLRRLRTPARWLVQTAAAINGRPVSLQQFDGASDHRQAERVHSRRYQSAELFDLIVYLVARVAHVHPAACRREQKRRPLEIKCRRRPSSPGRVRVKSRQELVAALRAEVHHIVLWRGLKSDVIRMNRHCARGYRSSMIPFGKPMHTFPDHAANLNLVDAVPARSATC
ncbi:hypothetical protein ACVIU7_005676 [Bradyrhizobium liaoningense]